VSFSAACEARTYPASNSQQMAAVSVLHLLGPVAGRCEKIDFRICSELGVKKIALGCRISDRWGVGKHLGSKIKSRKLKQINFFTSSRRDDNSAYGLPFGVPSVMQHPWHLAWDGLGPVSGGVFQVVKTSQSRERTERTLLTH
jgi:hypothetical protein